MLHEIVAALWFFLPVGLANMMPVFVANISWLKKYSYPIDFHRSFLGKRILGDHKTWRGFVAGVIGAVLLVTLQRYYFTHNYGIQSISLVDYSQINSWLFGFLCALGGLGGDAIKSFFKRQVGVASGKTWFPFDQIDYIIGGIVVTYFYVPLSASTYLLILMTYFLLHLLSSFIGYWLKLKESPL